MNNHLQLRKPNTCSHCGSKVHNKQRCRDLHKLTVKLSTERGDELYAALQVPSRKFSDEQNEANRQRSLRLWQDPTYRAKIEKKR